MNVRQISLDIDKRHAIREPITIAQGDRNGTTIAATIYDGGTLVTTSGLSARFRMRLPDGRHFYEKTATWNAASGTATVTIDETQAASAPGTTADAYFELLSGTTVIHSTSRFSVRVLRSATEGMGTPESYSDEVEALVDDLRAATQEAQGAAQDASDAATAAASAVADASQAVASANAAVTAATEANSRAMQAASTANSAASQAASAASSANQAATSANTAATSANTAAQRTEAAIAAVGDISEVAVPLMGPDVRGGAKLGDGLAITDGALGIDPDPQESTGAVRGAIASLTAKGWATQDGTPTPESPVPIQVARGRNLYRNGFEAESGTFTSGGITYTLGPNGEIRADGTASGNSWPYLGGSGAGSRNPAHFKLLQPGTYVASSGANHIQGRRLIGDGEAVETLFAKSTPPVTFTLEEASLVAVVPIVNSGETVVDLFEWVQVESGSTPTPYLPYGDTIGIDITHDGTTTTIPVPLPSKSYAASLPDGTADVLTIDGAGKEEWVIAVGKVTFDGGESWNAAGGTPSRVYTQLSDCKNAVDGGYSGYCDYYEVDATVINVANIRDNTILLSNKKASSSNGRLFVFDNTHATSINDWKALLAQNPITVLYPLATPTTEQVGYLDWPSIPDGATITCPELDALGVRYLIGNGVATMARQWYERGLAEHGGEALGHVAPIEGAVATANYARGSYIVHNGQLCKVTTAIATGEEIAIGTNVTATTVMAEVLALTS